MRVKICGITNLDDAIVAATAGADMLGFVFFPKSPRYIEPERAAQIAAELSRRVAAPKFVGVFVNETLDRVRAITQMVPLDLAQLHGDESAQMVRDLSPRVYKALRPRSPEEALVLIEAYREATNGNPPAFIVDAFDANKYGGTGARTDWDLAAGIARAFPILLAGGLEVGNVAEAVRTVRPWGVDVSSGVERSPGLKDHVKVRRFIEEAKSNDK